MIHILWLHGMGWFMKIRWYSTNLCEYYFFRTSESSSLHGQDSIIVYTIIHRPTPDCPWIKLLIFLGGAF